ncbi:hypothetical protein BAUCODRAFT_150932 [Baudoinia panamericana UAMH 10762]|uniref:Uncharacterized protein n=1 Tax=Baudoinia panamericana (strain UAMH 10762) TaxID=717646 RepID=M2N4J7_BAUPA|nr:uncharacterized protein BAUCODRAFT_150932 [Baudoinia panamericana UAMH 10762]EMC93645.1 hypothetical protein BAUCODRAFT_150932 [Baudoinia panamericana UAMH 10762]
MSSFLKTDDTILLAGRHSTPARFFGAAANDDAYPAFTARVESEAELEKLLGETALQDGKGLTIVDVVMAPEDMPEKAKAGLLKAGESLRCQQ